MALELDRTFEQLIDYVIDHQSRAAEAVRSQGSSRPWMNFAGDKLKTSAASKAETELHGVFSRDDVNRAYIRARQDPKAKSRETALAKISGDFMAACERDKRMQWRSRVRMFAHAAARSAGHGMTAGPLRKATVDYLQRLIMKSREQKKETA